MEIQKYVDRKKEIYNSLMEFIESPESQEELTLENADFENLLKSIEKQNIIGNLEEFIDFIRLIVIIANNHHRYPEFFQKVEQILLHFKNNITQSLSNINIYNEFESNKLLLLFLIKEEILAFDEQIADLIINKNEPNGIFYSNFFIPEMKKLNKTEYINGKYLEYYENDPKQYEEYRQQGENDSYICTLIRQDLIEDFISHVNRYQISLLSQIVPSVFETNQLLNERNATLIEYASFFGSIQICQYLLLNNVKIHKSLYKYSIHSNNSDFFCNYIEGNNNNNESSQKIYEKCLKESIKCHHNGFVNYFQDKLIEIEKSESFFDSILKYHNYLHFQNDFTQKYAFFYICFYDYTKIVELYINSKKELIESELDLFYYFYDSSKSGHYDKNKIEIIYYLLLTNKIQKLENLQITEIALPLSIKSIKYEAFKNFKNLEKVSIPSSVIEIGEFAFSGCKRLRKISIPNSIKYIGKRAFYKCSSLKRIKLPSSLKCIDFESFLKCTSLKQVIIPPSVEEIGSYAFAKCTSLVQILIPSSVTEIGNYILFGCSSLVKIFSFITSIPCGFCSDCSALTEIYIPSFITSMDDYSFSKCESNKNIPISQSVNSNEQFIKSIENGNSLSGINKIITNIHICAFSNCSSLTKISINASFINIHCESFCCCESLKEILINAQNIYIDSKAFSSCTSLKEISINASSIIIQICSFAKCSSLEYITFNANTIKLGKKAFYDCLSLKQIVYNDSCEIFITGSNCFKGCRSLINIPTCLSFENRLTGTFLECSFLTHVTIPSTCRFIGNNVFRKCSSLKQITFEIPSSLAFIGNGAFAECSSLEQLSIPSSVSKIEENCFSECTSLNEISFQITVSTKIFDISETKQLEQLEIPVNLTKISSKSFFECVSLEKIIIPSSVTKIDDYAFNGCKSLSSVLFESSSSLTSIGNGAFKNCPILNQITIPSTVISIGSFTFQDCISLNSVSFEMPSSLTSIGDGAFKNCPILNQITIPSSVISIGSFTFQDCISLNLVSFEIPSSLTEIGEGAFKNCEYLIMLSIPPSVTTIGKEAFKDCLSMKQISIPSSINRGNLNINAHTKIIEMSTNCLIH